MLNNYEVFPILKLPKKELVYMVFELLRPCILNTVTKGMGFETPFVHVATAKNPCRKLIMGERTEGKYGQRIMAAVDMGHFDKTCYIDLSTTEAQQVWFKEYPGDSDEIVDMCKKARGLSARVREVLICCPVPEEAVLQADPDEAGATITYP